MAIEQGGDSGETHTFPEQEEKVEIKPVGGKVVAILKVTCGKRGVTVRREPVDQNN